MNRLVKRIGALLIVGAVLLTPMATFAEESQEELDVIEGGSLQSSESGITTESAENEDYSAEEGETPEVVEDINSARNGVVQVNYVYIDDNDKTHIIKGGTGFIIGSADKREYVLTCESNVTIDKETKDAAFKYLGIPKEKNGEYKDVKLEVQVVAASDVTVNARLIASSDELDFAVLELEQPIHTRVPLSIYTSENGSRENLPYAIADKVFALGYPDEIVFEKNEKYYSSDRIAMTTGSIANIATLHDVFLIQHDATVGRNNCGGPLINEDGKVIGMNIIQKDGDYYSALDSTEMVDVLDALGIEYTKSFYKEEASEEASISLSVDVPDKPVKKQSIPILQIALVSVVCMLLVVAVIAALLIVKNKNRNQKKKEAKQEAEIKPFNPSKIPSSTQASTMNDGSDTSLLNSSKENGTTVLGESPTTVRGVVSGTLIRKRNKKQELIDKEVFTIGKDSLHTDLYIKDNTAISRKHAMIRSSIDGVYIEDCNSTNGTYVNGKRVIAGHPVKLHDGSIIKLADEEFEYRI